MTDPNRLIDTDDLGGDLLASARMDAPSSKARTRAAAALGIGVGIAAMTAGGTASASAGAGAGATTAAAKVGGVSLLTKIAFGTAIVAAVGGGTAVAVRESSAPPPVVAPVATVAAPKATPTPVQAPATKDEKEEAPVVEANALPSVSPSIAKAPVKTAGAAAPAQEKESALSREVHSLDAAKKLLEARDANGALGALDRHDREFPQGALHAESAMLRVEALLAKGDDAGAKSRAKELLARDPNGPHAKRLHTIVDR